MNRRDFLFWSLSSMAAFGSGLLLNKNAQAIIFQSADQEIVSATLKEFWKYRHLETNYLCSLIAESFAGIPYKENTLEVNQNINEDLIINLRSFDCVTFLENVIALCLCLKRNQHELDKRSFEVFCRNIQFIRYRKGQMNGYESRLHYFSDWLRDGQRKGLIQLLMGDQPQITELNLLSKSLKDDHRKKSIEIIESKLDFTNRKQPIAYFDSYSIEKALLKSGNIIGFVSNKTGLDFNHVAFVKEIPSPRNGRFTFIHASSINKKVEIYSGNLSEYCQNKKSNKGIAAAKLNF